jgi:molecular chaperone GrpE (heat shock protein)
MKAIHRQLVDTLKAHDVIAFDPRGNRFDPALHEAAGVVSSPGNTSSGAVASGENGPVNKDRVGAEADGLVAEVILTGYTIGEGERRRVLRPAKVTVFKKRG